MSNNKKSNKITALLIIVAMVSSFLMGGSLSRFLTEVNSNSSSRVAIWGINDGEVEMELFNSKYDLDADNVLAQSHNGDNIIAPGLSDTSPFNIIKYDNIAPEVAYELKITVDDTEVDELIKNNTSIQWKLDDGNYTDWETFKTSLLSLSGDPSGYKLYAPGEFAPAFKDNTQHTISWQWVMDNNNTEMDTLLGNTAAERDVIAKIKVNITAEQFDGQSSGMLEGNGQTVNVNDIQPLTFRSLAPYDEFQNVTVNGETLTRNTDYTVTSGSTVVTLNKSYLEDLDSGTYDISIVSDNMTANTKFYVKNMPIVHNGIIPEGGTYYKNKSNIGIGDYEGAIVYSSGMNFPELETGDVYVYGDFEYSYNMKASVPVWEINEEQDGWGVRVLDDSKYEYDEILTTINGKNLVNMTNTFASALVKKSPSIPITVTDMTATFYFSCLEEAPIIPNSVINMYKTFSGTGLTKAPVIPENVVNIESLFEECLLLTGEVIINANPSSYNHVFSGTVNSIILSGSSDLLDEIISVSYDHNVIIKGSESVVSKTLSENSWETISEVTKAGNAAEYWKVGDKTTVDVNGTDYEVAIAGIDHDGDNTVTFVFTEAIKEAHMNDSIVNVGGWENSKMRTVIIPEILNQMENKDLIKLVEKKTIKGSGDGSSNDTIFELITTDDKLFLLSYNEVFGDSVSLVGNNFNEGIQYEYFETPSNRIIGNGLQAIFENGWYWSLRTPNVFASSFYAVNGDSGTCGGDATTGDYVVPAFVIG